ncbi:MAG: hypothetical protein KAJ75_06395 [Alphaproteobacteria bacterium]|nr:hypothetical protein [Alphaproteobacteria bacterium]
MQESYREADRYTGTYEPNLTELIKDTSTLKIMKSDNVQLQELMAVISKAKNRILKN